MSMTSKTLVSTAATLAALVALPATAQQTAPATATAADAKAKSTVTRAPDAMTVVVDAETGAIRAATAAEIEDMQQAAPQSAYSAAQTSALATAMRTHMSGAVGVRLTNDMMHSSVLVRNADGSFNAMCVGTNGVPHALHVATTAKPVATSKLETE